MDRAYNKFLINILEAAISGKKAVGRPRLQYVKQFARNTGADSYPAMKRMTCSKSIWKAANQKEDWGIRRRRKEGRKEGTCKYWSWDLSLCLSTLFELKSWNLPLNAKLQGKFWLVWGILKEIPYVCVWIRVSLRRIGFCVYYAE